MSIRISAIAQGVQRSTSLPNGNSAYTMMARCLMTNVGTPTATFRALMDIDSGANLGDILYMTGDGAVPSLWVNNTTSAVGTSAIDTVRTRHMAMVRESATRLLVYCDGVLDATNTADVSARAATSTMGFGQALSTSSGEDLQSAFIEDLRVWNRALTRAEVNREMRAQAPVSRAGLLGWVPALTEEHVFDLAIGGRWTLNGSPTRALLMTPRPRTRRLRSVAAANITGTLAKTLAALTSTGAGAVDVAGTLAQTLGALTSSGAGAVNVDGTLAKTLGALTVVGAGSVGNNIDGSLAQTLGALVSAGAGTVNVDGQGNITLGALTSVGTGAVNVDGTLAKTLGQLVVAGVGDNGAAPAATDGYQMIEWRRRGRR